ncbi:hypothetical protein TVAG_180390 [Trichomonas vaginalis G3]|uniref:Uncharacterized protein n=1 Tax=Trichomonas vaginalis (strain ATCC PRA-98 / G3) TaxID=412133 RepID=A2EE68_TRIV3|nr:hypothetical protein TVAGG3_0614210 [Trichomonas vaginalis G3]EAY09065.1 hypothetical protein TVAG_180390 [Trichomonas vaginalis G3]KAI5503419.1 hypothetical protein TVAGG3_0614210 [Trichomonas vaginalis G3]|eukprot:XP_001321288.1 hypothetical protein [Trichomonas vaginalis G3]
MKSKSSSPNRKSRPKSILSPSKQANKPNDQYNGNESTELDPNELEVSEKTQPIQFNNDTTKKYKKPRKLATSYQGKQSNKIDQPNLQENFAQTNPSSFLESLTDSTEILSDIEDPFSPLKLVQCTQTESSLTHAPLSIETNLFGERIDPTYNRKFTINKVSNYFVQPRASKENETQFEEPFKGYYIRSVEIPPFDSKEQIDYYDYNKMNTAIRNERKLVEIS